MRHEIECSSKVKKTCRITQKAYLKSVLESEQMDKAKPVITPLEVGAKLIPTEVQEQYPGYREIVGKLMYCLEVLR